MWSQLEVDLDEGKGTELSFINPSNENQAINEPDRPGPNKGDGIFSALGYRISLPEVVKLCQSATVTESQDIRGRVYRLNIEKRSEDQMLRYRLGLLEDGQAWAVMSKAQVMEIPTLVVRFRGIWMREAPAALLARLYTSPEGQLRSRGAALDVTDERAALDDRARRSTDQEKVMSYAGFIAAHGRGMRKRERDEATESTLARKSSGTERSSSSTRNPRQTYKISPDKERMDHGDGSDEDPIKETRRPPRNSSPMSGAVWR